MKQIVLPVLLSLLVIPSVGLSQPPKQSAVPSQEIQFFEAKVRPVLAAKCHSCHGPKKQSGGIRLDSRTAILDESDQGPIVVPGHPGKSILLRVLSHEGKIKMPPKEKLSPAVIDDLTAWIKMGAPWPERETAVVGTNAWKSHWAFKPIMKPTVPAAKDRNQTFSPIDAFILAKLAEKGLALSPMAEPRALVRRLTFDLIGLPPTPEEVESFVKDCDDAKPDQAKQFTVIEKHVDRLLASPHYGERWGRYWLDVARYADTKGYVFFEEAPFPWAYTYRDYVIRSFNEDLPYDRFILEQMAADQLPLKDDKRALTALGFLTLGGRFMSNQHDILDDRIDVVTRGLMGMTMTCARCHDHKYDPISMKDYYGLYGVFASCAEPTVPPLFEPPPQTDAYAKFDKELKKRKQKLSDFVKAKHTELVENARKRVAEYLLAAHALHDQPNTDDFMFIAETNDLNPTMIVRYQKQLQRTSKKHDPVFAPWHALADLPEKDFATKGKAVLKQLEQPDPKRPINPLIVKRILNQPPKSTKELASLYAAVLLAVDKKYQDNEWKVLTDPAEEELRLVFYGPDAAANVALLPYGDLSLLPDRASQAKLQEYRKALEQWRSTGSGAPPRAHVLEDLQTPFEPYVFLRGNPNQRGDAVARQLPALLASHQSGPFQKGSGRLELARAIVSRDNPLTARVLVNRLWQHHFGVGLVRTPSDFGLRSDPPSHPELLDYLAATFMNPESQNGEGKVRPWSIKTMQRMIVLSRTYLQQSADRPECVAVDPENRLLWKMSRQRLDFEATRDALLAVANRLDTKIGGPSVNEPLALSANRRTLYSYVDRLNVPGLFRTFDFPSPDATSPLRENTTIAPQALFLMNHPFVMECARNVLKRGDITREKDASRKIDRLYRILFGRPPSTEELRIAQVFLQGAPHSVSWERYVHALLQTNEFCWVD